MGTTLIRGGKDAVAVQVDEHGIRIDIGPDGISASITLDFGEARLLAESILDGMNLLLAAALKATADPGVLGPRPDAMWWVLQGDGRQVSFQKLNRRERDLVLMSNPVMWPLRDRLFVKRFEDDHLETGFLRPDRGPSIWDGCDLIEAFETFEQMVDSGWRVD